ncbi:LysR family transcriptional regulator [Gracilibacillus sp. YIM 98692]|uniref:LysR family transcriptional regulator n=1 Tax=Gracilibacillus sp. YIM 98692 TaxID=2663532 RepID=UPI0013D091C6|nr:LysR family transcriptional regulator [Gracilibacillus sp. YIM 98692]
MDIKHLQYFIEVTNTTNFTQAADNLYITQPALSRIIKSLEDELGVSLFIRSRKKILLTDAGEVLYKYASIITEQIESLEMELEQLQTLKTGHIRIGLPTVVNSFFFSELIAAFHREYPAVTFQLEENGSRIVEEKISNGSLDCGVVVLTNSQNMFDYYTFVKETLTLVVPTSHPFAGKKQISLKELKDQSFIMFNQDFELRNRIMNACKEIGFHPKIISETSQLDFIEEMVASNVGVTLLPESTSKELTSKITTVPVVHPVIEWNLAFIWKKDSYLSQTNKKFIAFAKEKLLHSSS